MTSGCQLSSTIACDFCSSYLFHERIITWVIGVNINDFWDMKKTDVTYIHMEETTTVFTIDDDRNQTHI